MFKHSLDFTNEYFALSIAQWLACEYMDYWGYTLVLCLCWLLVTNKPPIDRGVHLNCCCEKWSRKHHSLSCCHVVMQRVAIAGLNWLYIYIYHWVTKNVVIFILCMSPLVSHGCTTTLKWHNSLYFYSLQLNFGHLSLGKFIVHVSPSMDQIIDSTPLWMKDICIGEKKIEIKLLPFLQWPFTTASLLKSWYFDLITLYKHFYEAQY